MPDIRYDIRSQRRTVPGAVNGLMHASIRYAEPAEARMERLAQFPLVGRPAELCQEGGSPRSLVIQPGVSGPAGFGPTNIARCCSMPSSALRPIFVAIARAAR